MLIFSQFDEYFEDEEAYGWVDVTDIRLVLNNITHW